MFVGIIQGTTEDSSARKGRTAFVRCLTRNELTVKPFFRQARRIWVVPTSSNTCHATADGGKDLLLLCSPPFSIFPHITLRRGFKSLGMKRTTHRHEGSAGCLICGSLGMTANQTSRGT